MGITSFYHVITHVLFENPHFEAIMLTMPCPSNFLRSRKNPSRRSCCNQTKIKDSFLFAYTYFCTKTLFKFLPAREFSSALRVGDAKKVLPNCRILCLVQLFQRHAQERRHLNEERIVHQSTHHIPKNNFPTLSLRWSSILQCTHDPL